MSRKITPHGAYLAAKHWSHPLMTGLTWCDHIQASPWSRWQLWWQRLAQGLESHLGPCVLRPAKTLNTLKGFSKCTYMFLFEKSREAQKERKTEIDFFSFSSSLSTCPQQARLDSIAVSHPSTWGIVCRKLRSEVEPRLEQRHFEVGYGPCRQHLTRCIKCSLPNPKHLDPRRAFG